MFMPATPVLALFANIPAEKEYSCIPAAKSLQ
jgi:hypothetical protein